MVALQRTCPIAASKTEGVYSCSRALGHDGPCAAHVLCSRCQKPIKDFQPPSNGFTAGYYFAFAWPKYANPGEVYICDACMWADPRYQMDYGLHKAAGLDPLATAKSRYRYARVVVDGADRTGQPVEIIAGVEVLLEESLLTFYAGLRLAIERQVSPVIADATDEQLARIVEEVILAVWTGRSYFIEIARGPLKQWLQVFAP